MTDLRGNKRLCPSPLCTMWGVAVCKVFPGGTLTQHFWIFPGFVVNTPDLTEHTYNMAQVKKPCKVLIGYIQYSLEHQNTKTFIKPPLKCHQSGLKNVKCCDWVSWTFALNNVLYPQYVSFQKKTKNPAYGRQSISRPMRIVAPIPQ